MMPHGRFRADDRTTLSTIWVAGTALVVLATTSVPSSAAHELTLTYDPPDILELEAGWELQDLLALEHPELFAGMWYEDNILVVAVAGDDSDVEQIKQVVETVVERPDAIRYMMATYTESALESYRRTLNDSFNRLAEDHGVQSLYVDVRQNKVKVETSSSSPEMTSLPRFVSGVPSTAIVFEQADPLRLADDHESNSELAESAPQSSSWTTRLVQLALVCAAGVLAARRLKRPF